MSTIDFAQVNPRAGGFINPLKLNDPTLQVEYTKLARSYTFPAGYDNGLFNTAVGIVLCLAAFVCLGTGIESNMRTAMLAAGVVAGVVVGVLYVKIMQLRVVFPRGASYLLDGSEKGPAIVFGPAIAYIVVPVALYFMDNPVWIYFALGAVCALIEQFAYFKCGRNLLAVTAFMLFIVPYVAAQLIGMSGDVFANMMSVVPYQGLVFACTGVFLTNKASSIVPRGHDRDLIRFLLESDNLSRKYLGLTYLSASLDSDMIPDLAKCMQHENYVISYIAQIAFGNLWGPKPRELCLPVNYAISPKLNEENRERYQDKERSERKTALDRWVKHHRLIEEKVACLAAQDDEATDDLFALAMGQNVKIQHARIGAIEMLGPMRTQKAYATLMTLLQHGDRRVARAAEASFFGADSKAIFFLEKFYVAPTAWQRARAIRATRHLLDYLAIFDSNEHSLAQALLEPDIDGLLDTTSTNTFAEAIALLPAETREDLGILDEYLGNDRPLIRVAALAAITRQCPEIAHDHLVAALDDPSAAVRYAALLLIGNLIPEDAGDLLSRLLDDPHPRVADCADRTLGRFEANVKRSGW